MNKRQRKKHSKRMAELAAAVGELSQALFEVADALAMFRLGEQCFAWAAPTTPAEPGSP